MVLSHPAQIISNRKSKNCFVHIIKYNLFFFFLLKIQYPFDTDDDLLIDSSVSVNW